MGEGGQRRNVAGHMAFAIFDTLNWSYNDAECLFKVSDIVDFVWLATYTNHAF